MRFLHRQVLQHLQSLGILLQSLIVRFCLLSIKVFRIYLYKDTSLFQKNIRMRFRLFLQLFGFPF